LCVYSIFFFFFSSRRRHTRWPRDWSSDVCSSDLIELLRSWGVNEGTQVVAYDAHGGMFAARVWWMLRWVGHEAVAVLDGGVPAWQSAGLPLSTDAPAPRPRGTIAARDPLVTTVDVNTVLQNVEHGGRQ